MNYDITELLRQEKALLEEKLKAWNAWKKLEEAKKNAEIFVGMELGRENFEKAIARQFSGLKIDEDIVKKALGKTKLNTEKASTWTEQELFGFAHELRFLSKPMIIAANKIDTPNGKENYEKLKKKFPHIKIIMVTGYKSVETAAEAARLGASGYIVKPFKSQEILETVKKNLGS